MSSDLDMPKWDVALAALAAEEFGKKGGPLTLDDFRGMANTHAIRLDDIMETMFLLVLNREWVYLDPSGNVRVLDQDKLDSLFKNRRLTEDDLSTFDGKWQPASES